MGGVLLAAPASGSGKTTVTLGLIRALTRHGHSVQSAKSGPDYIDPRFHEAASGQRCVTLDGWAMTPDRVRSLATQSLDVLVVEGAMGLFDGASPDNAGSSADLAKILGIRVILVVDAGKMAGSIAALVRGFSTHDPDLNIGGVILNNVGSARHDTMLRRALEPLGMAVLGSVPRLAHLKTPSRHLGLMQASERGDLEGFLEAAADTIAQHIDLNAVLSLTKGDVTLAGTTLRMPPPAQKIAVAQDQAFGFSYPHMLADWQSQGAEITLFSPLNNDPVPEAEFVFLPGGYPELHAGKIAANAIFLNSLKRASQTSDIYGECGGYMVLGEALTDADGHTHKMAGLLKVTTSFKQRKLHLGYRRLNASRGIMAGRWKGHEFHYSTTTSTKGTPLFAAQDAEGTSLPDMGLIQGRVSGSYAHIIDRA